MSEDKHESPAVKPDPPRNKKGGYLFTKENAREMQRRGVPIRKHKGDMRRSARVFAEMAVRSGKVADAEDVSSLAESKGANLSLLDETVRTLWIKAMKGDNPSIRTLMDLMGIGTVAEIKVKTESTESLSKLKKALAEDPEALDRIIAETGRQTDVHR